MLPSTDTGSSTTISIGLSGRSSTSSPPGRRNCMLEELKEEQIGNKVGGRFKLSTLIQKRLVALNRGARPLVEMQTKNPMEVVIQEIVQDKIFLDASGNVGLSPEAETAIRDRGPNLDDL